MWSQPPGGASVTSYIIHYNVIGGGPETTGPLCSLLTRYDIEGLTKGAPYNVSVEATSKHLSGESEKMIISLRMFKPHMYE